MVGLRHRGLRVFGAGIAVAGLASLFVGLMGCSVSDGSRSSAFGVPGADGGGESPAAPVMAFPVADRGVLVDPFPPEPGRAIPDLSNEGVFVAGTQAAQILDTRVFAPQIAPADVANADSRRVKVHLPAHERPVFEEVEPEHPLRDFRLGGTGNLAGV